MRVTSSALPQKWYYVLGFDEAINKKIFTRILIKDWNLISDIKNKSVENLWIINSLSNWLTTVLLTNKISFIFVMKY